MAIYKTLVNKISIPAEKKQGRKNMKLVDNLRLLIKGEN